MQAHWQQAQASRPPDIHVSMYSSSKKKIKQQLRPCCLYGICQLHKAASACWLLVPWLLLLLLLLLL
jgi:hypothetical protein